MEAHIHAVDKEREFFHDRPSKGKRSWVADDAFTIQVHSGALYVAATSSEWIGSGERGGAVKDLSRTLSLWLTPHDLKRLLDAAISAGLLTTAVAVVEAPEESNSHSE